MKITWRVGDSELGVDSPTYEDLLHHAFGPLVAKVATWVQADLTGGWLAFSDAPRCTPSPCLRLPHDADLGGYQDEHFERGVFLYLGHDHRLALDVDVLRAGAYYDFWRRRHSATVETAFAAAVHDLLPGWDVETAIVNTFKDTGGYGPLITARLPDSGARVPLDHKRLLRETVALVETLPDCAKDLRAP